MFTLRLDKARHYLPDQPTEMDAWFAREFPGEDLFIYFHKRTRNWTIATWMCQDAGTALEIMVLGKLPCFLTRAQADEFRFRMNRGPVPANIRKVAEAQEASRQARWDEEGLRIEEGKARILRDLHPGPGSQSRIVVPARLDDSQYRKLRVS